MAPNQPQLAQDGPLGEAWRCKAALALDFWTLLILYQSEKSRIRSRVRPIWRPRKLRNGPNMQHM
eukprot:9470917-Pyramimonas_sp.AAC.1